MSLRYRPRVHPSLTIDQHSFASISRLTRYCPEAHVKERTTTDHSKSRLPIIGLALIKLMLIGSVGFMQGCSESPASQNEQATAQLEARHTVLIILDTVRADHLSVCNYQRPTSPFLATLFARASFATCNAYSPGSWTLPSHASYFTGLPAEEHGAISAFDGGEELDWGTRFRPLADRFETLAERFRGSGYRTVLVSGNPVLGKASGLSRGFDHTRIAEKFGDMYGDDLVAAVNAELERMKNDEKLFLVVNIADAHNPWSRIPTDLDWLPPRPPLHLSLKGASPFARYVRGELDSAEMEKTRNHYTDVYDYGIFRSDQTLAKVWKALQDSGVIADGTRSRTVVTSDHGELLYEHGSFGHGGNLWQGTVRVPFLFIDGEAIRSNAGATQQAEGADPAFSATELFRLLQGLPPSDEPVTALANWRQEAATVFGAEYPQFRERTAALWQAAGEVILLRNGLAERYNLAEDPEQKAPMPFNDAETIQLLRETLEQAGRNGSRNPASKELLEQLRSLGYAE